MADSKSTSASLAGSDMAMYAAIVGRVPEIDPNAVIPLSHSHEIQNERPWSPIVLSIYLKQIYRQGTIKLNKPEITAWIKRHSVVAHKRLLETRVRIASIQKDRAA